MHLSIRDYQDGLTAASYSLSELLSSSSDASSGTALTAVGEVKNTRASLARNVHLPRLVGLVFSLARRDRCGRSESLELEAWRAGTSDGRRRLVETGTQEGVAPGIRRAPAIGPLGHTIAPR